WCSRDCACATCLPMSVSTVLPASRPALLRRSPTRTMSLTSGLTTTMPPPHSSLTSDPLVVRPSSAPRISITPLSRHCPHRPNLYIHDPYTPHPVSHHPPGLPLGLTRRRQVAGG